MDNSSELRQERKTRGQTGIRIDGCRKYMTKHVQDLMSSNMELWHGGVTGVTVLGTGRD